MTDADLDRLETFARLLTAAGDDSVERLIAEVRRLRADAKAPRFADVTEMLRLRAENAELRERVAKLTVKLDAAQGNLRLMASDHAKPEDFNAPLEGND